MTAAYRCVFTVILASLLIALYSSTLASIRPSLGLLAAVAVRRTAVTSKRPSLLLFPVPNRTTRTMSTAAKSFYDLEADLPKGDKLSMAQLKGKVVIIVNVASKVRCSEECLARSGT